MASSGRCSVNRARLPTKAGRQLHGWAFWSRVDDGGERSVDIGQQLGAVGLLAGLGMDAVLLDPTCSDPLYGRTARVAMGEAYGLPWAWIPRLPGGLGVLRAHGFRLVALTPDDGAVPLDELALGAAGDGGVDRRVDGWRCGSEPKGRGCRAGPSPPPTSGPASPCGAGSTR
jgi:hypothetical protein